MNTPTKPRFYCMVDVAPSQRWTQPGCNDALCRMYATGSCIWVNQINVRQLHVCLHQLDTADYTPWTGCPRVTIPVQDRQIRLPHLRSHFTTVVETAATFVGQGNPCVSTKTVRNRLRSCTLCTTPYIWIAPLLVPFVHHRNLTLQCSGQHKTTCRTGVLRFSADAQSACSPMVSVLTKL
jgi:hypothetical protein